MATKKSTPVIEVEEEEEVIENLDDSTVTFKKSHFYSVLVVLAFAVGILVGYVAWGRICCCRRTRCGRSRGSTTRSCDRGTAISTLRDSTDGYPSLGPDDAEIVIVEFSDFQCPFCRKFHDETYQSLLDAYSGQIPLCTAICR